MMDSSDTRPDRCSVQLTSDPRIRFESSVRSRRLRDLVIEMHRRTKSDGNSPSTWVVSGAVDGDAPGRLNILGKGFFLDHRRYESIPEAASESFDKPPPTGLDSKKMSRPDNEGVQAPTGWLQDAVLPTRKDLEHQMPPKKRHVLAQKRQWSDGIFFERMRKRQQSLSMNQNLDNFSAKVEVHARTRPLRPPMPPPSASWSAPSQHHVKIETPFMHPRPALMQNQIPPSNQTSSGAASGSPRYLLAPYVRLLEIVRKGGTSSPKLFSQKLFAQRNSRAQRTGHLTSGLARVSSVLAELRSLSSKARSRSDHSTSSVSSRQDSHNRSGNETEQHGDLLERVQSMEMVSKHDSAHSSLMLLRMGSPPPNTPEEKATYRVKRSPSTETEEFLKIDISVRGGTSYLPSEAKRIHTPPPPKEGPDGRKRGFFFDYHVAKSDNDCTEHPSELRPVPRQPTYNSRGDSHPWPSSIAVADNRPGGTPASQQPCSRNVDWYSAHLAALEFTDDTAHRDAYQNKVPEGLVSRSSTFVDHQPPQRQEQNLDFTIPEHLPTSPLCPRHPRYWRIIRYGPRQFRGCWMHGVSEEPASTWVAAIDSSKLGRG